MFPQRLFPIALIVLLLLVFGAFWIGKGSLPHVWSQQRELAQLQADNAAARERNDALKADLSDFKSGTEMVEEKARMELGMVRTGETLVQFTQMPANAAAAPPSAAASR